MFHNSKKKWLTVCCKQLLSVTVILSWSFSTPESWYLQRDTAEVWFYTVIRLHSKLHCLSFWLNVWQKTTKTEFQTVGYFATVKYVYIHNNFKQFRLDLLIFTDILANMKSVQSCHWNYIQLAHNLKWGYTIFQFLTYVFIFYYIIIVIFLNITIYSSQSIYCHMQAVCFWYLPAA